MHVSAMGVFRRLTAFSLCALTGVIMMGCQAQLSNEQPKNPQEVAPVASPLQSPGKILADANEQNSLSTKPTEEVRMLSAAKAQDVEPNDVLEEATNYANDALRKDVNFRGQLSQKGDVDYLVFESAFSGKVQFSMTLQQKMDYTFELLDSNGKNVGVANAANDLSKVLSVELQSGQKYYLKVFSPTEQFDASGNGDYELLSILIN